MSSTNKAKTSSVSSHLEAGRSVSPAKSTSKFFFTDPHLTQPATSHSKKKNASLSSKRDTDSNVLSFADSLFNLPAEKSEPLSFIGAISNYSDLNQNSDPNIDINNAESNISMNTTSYSAVLHTEGEKPQQQVQSVSVEEAEAFLKAHDIDKIFENYNAVASQLLTNGFDSISHPYDRALKVNQNLQDFNNSSLTEIAQLGKRRRESSEAMETLRNRMSILAPPIIHELSSSTK